MTLLIDRRNMKRLLVFIMIISAVLSLCPTPAFATYKEEITFRGIPFGTKYEDVVKQLNDEGIELKEPKKYAVYYSVYSKETVNVAGYDMSIVLNFVSPKSYNDPIEECVLYWAGYFVDRKSFGDIYRMNDKDPTFAKWEDYSYDMRMKLKSLYGDYDKIDRKDDQNKKTKKIDVTIYDLFYYGQNKTSVDFKFVYDYAACEIRSTIYYVWETGEKQVDKLDAEYQADKNGGVNGL